MMKTESEVREALMIFQAVCGETDEEKAFAMFSGAIDVLKWVVGDESIFEEALSRIRARMTAENN